MNDGCNCNPLAEEEFAMCSDDCGWACEGCSEFSTGGVLEGLAVKDFVVSKPDVKDAKQAELDAKAVEWFNNQADLAEKDERISVLGIRVAGLLAEADECDELSASQMAINAQLEKENRSLRDELNAAGETLETLESKNAELMTQFAALDADYDQIKVENDANVDNLATIVSMYNDLHDSSVAVLDNDLKYRVKIAKLKYKALKAQIVNPNE
jgi:septal ring factor EnvC (AmiA/AmiB activator)